MKSLGFEDSVVVLGTYLQKIREVLHFAFTIHVHCTPESYALCLFPWSQINPSSTLSFAGGGSGKARQECCECCRGGQRHTASSISSSFTSSPAYGASINCGTLLLTRYQCHSTSHQSITCIGSGY